MNKKLRDLLPHENIYMMRTDSLITDIDALSESIFDAACRHPRNADEQALKDRQIKRLVEKRRRLIGDLKSTIEIEMQETDKP